MKREEFEGMFPNIKETESYVYPCEHQWKSIKDCRHPNETRLLVKISMLPHREDTKDLITIARLTYFVDKFIWIPEDIFAGYDGVDHIEQDAVTHWMPIPSAPVENLK